MSDQSLAICGGGLWGGLLAYRLNQLHPELGFKLFEKNHSLGGNHTWSFHESDVSPEALDWIKPFIVQSWEGYTVKFPKYQRSFTGRYHSITSERFDSVIRSGLGSDKLFLGQECPEKNFVDARGMYPYDLKEVGFQKFFGLHVELELPHGLTEPILMDSTVEQIDGYRFVYYLPFTKSEILIEDTYYSTSADLDVDGLKRNIESTIDLRGWKIKKVIREEQGVLPLPWSQKHGQQIGPTSLSGMFHDVTGYSLPDAVRMVERLSNIEFSLAAVSKEISNYQSERHSNRKYFQLLNRMMFQAAEPEKRYRVLEHFYKLPQPLIERFYRGESSTGDKLRILMGKPPVPVGRAIKSIMSATSRWS